MKIPYYSAKDKDSATVYQGFYFEYPKTTYCFEEDYNREPPELVSCLVVYRMTDWGLPNVPQLVTIDKRTLKFVGYIETDRDYYIPKEYLEN